MSSAKTGGAEIRVRLAPSPSGYLHVGTARMAIANYLFARHYGGKFLLRIEDTDAERSDAALLEPILSALQWVGTPWDEEIVYQSRRIALYNEYAGKILESRYGYRCFCSPERLQVDREKARADKKPLQYDRRCLNLTPGEIDSRIKAGDKFAIRLKIPDGQTRFTDMVSGEVSRRNEDLEDFVIARSDGTATYNLAVVVDDHDMGITHVIRGNDHITNTFKQIHLYHALGFAAPEFGHLPMILRPDKRKVSKRLGDKDVAQYRHEGILPEAMFNYLCLLGWSPKTDREIYTSAELIEIFDANNFNPSNAIFDEEKLVAFNREHMVMKSDHELATLAAPFLVDAGLTTKYWLETRWDYLRAVVRLLRERARRISDFASLGGYFFSFGYRYDAQAAVKQFTAESAEWLGELAARFESLKEFTHDGVEATLSEMAEEKGLKKAQLIHPTRLAVSGVPVGPSLFEMLVVLTQPVVVERMRRAAEYIRKQQSE
ncbi:MAG: glutamate--tRNA ligase [candidate division Zixibacteria bacterium]|nr:glutamate--tRNA ligase [candidate division Zixibacteria bacterium]